MTPFYRFLFWLNVLNYSGIIPNTVARVLISPHHYPYRKIPITINPTVSVVPIVLPSIFHTTINLSSPAIPKLHIRSKIYHVAIPTCLQCLSIVCRHTQFRSRVFIHGVLPSIMRLDEVLRNLADALTVSSQSFSMTEDKQLVVLY